jgi:outer membrane immunogenic protein
MRKAAIGIVAVAAIIGTPVFAADMVVKAPPPAPAPAWSWTGFYLGANFGGGWEDETLVRTDDNSPLAFPPGFREMENDNGVLGGGQIGFDYQWNRLVFGVQGTFDAASLLGSSSELAVNGTEVVHQASKISSLFDAGARVGYAVSDQLLPYVSGGAAWMEHSQTANTFTVPGGAFVETSTGSEWHTGWFIGSGVEYRITRNWSAFVEYDYYGGFDGNSDRTAVATGPGIPLGLASNHTYQADINVVKIGLNWRFGGGPINARD